MKDKEKNYQIDDIEDHPAVKELRGMFADLHEQLDTLQKRARLLDQAKRLWNQTRV